MGVASVEETAPCSELYRSWCDPGTREICFGPWVGGVRILHGKPVRVSVVAVDRTDQRSVGWMELSWARPGCRVIKVQAAMATRECVLVPERTARAAHHGCSYPPQLFETSDHAHLRPSRGPSTVPIAERHPGQHDELLEPGNDLRVGIR
jgi:hypothetical protein